MAKGDFGVPRTIATHPFWRVAMKVYFFGCMRGPGHYLHSNPSPRGLTERRALCAIERSNPWGYKIDGKLCPAGAQVQGRALVHHKDGWTALSFWDRSVD